MKKLLFLLSFSLCIMATVNAQCIIVCNNNVNVSLDSNGEAVITTDNVLEGPAPNCSVEIGLFTSVGGSQVLPYGPDITLNCDHLGSYVYEVREVGGNGNSCWGILITEDKINACPLNIGPDSLGIVYSDGNGFAIFDAEVRLNGNLVDEVYDWLDVIAEADLLDGENVLSFDPPVIDIMNLFSSITSLDIVEAQKVLLEITNEYPLRAVLADVDGSGFLGVNDLVVLRQYILGIINELPAKDNLYFSNTYSFPSDFDVFDFTTENYREYRFEKDDVTQEDLYFNVFEMGDINGVTTPDSLKSVTASNRSSKVLTITDRAVTQGQIIQVPMQLDAEEININGLQLSLGLTGLNLESVIDNYTGAQLMYNKLSNADIRFSFIDDADQQYFDITLELEVLADGMLSDMIALNSDFENSVVSYTGNADIDLTFEQSSSVDEVLGLNGNVLSGSIEINLPINHTATIYLYDLQGKLISTHIPQSHKVVLQKNDFPMSGMYIISTYADGKAVSKKLIVI